MHDGPARSIRASEEERIGLAWLVRMRWGALGSELATIAITAWVLSIELPLATMLTVLAVQAASNLALERWAPSARRLVPAMGAALLLDVAALTALLYESGGPSNPFGAVYLVYVTLAAVLLPRAYTTATVAACALGYGLLFLDSVPLGGLDDPHAMHAGGGGPLFLAHLYGMYVALVLAALLVGYFVSRLAGAVRLREAELSRARAQAANAERLAALTTLCAGAAHELGTPLGTIALAASELARAADELAAERVAQDARLIRSEVDRCRAILDRMAARFGEATGDRPARMPVADVVEAVRALLPDGERGRVVFITDPSEVELPLGAVAQALANLVDNALHAAEGEVEVRIAQTGGELHLAVRDRGPGMPAEVLRRATDPFFTTKDAGRGMGLGLYLCQVTAERLGGRLSLRSEPGQGTEAALIVPAPPARSPR